MICLLRANNYLPIAHGVEEHIYVVSSRPKLGAVETTFSFEVSADDAIEETARSWEAQEGFGFVYHAK